MVLYGPAASRLWEAPWLKVPEMTVDELVKTLKVKSELTLLVVTDTDLERLEVKPKPISALAVKAVVEFAGTINAHPLLPVVQLAP